jgi:hypothetical protein
LRINTRCEWPMLRIETFIVGLRYGKRDATTARAGGAAYRAAGGARPAATRRLTPTNPPTRAANASSSLRHRVAPNFDRQPAELREHRFGTLRLVALALALALALVLSRGLARTLRAAASPE